MINNTFTLRWRVREGKVLLWKRHIRELNHYEFTPALVAWVYERLEWAAAHLMNSDTDAVLVLSVDPAAEIQVSLDDARVMPEVSLDDIIFTEDGSTERDAPNVEESSAKSNDPASTNDSARDNPLIQGLKLDEDVPPSTVWIVDGEGTLVAGAEALFSAVDTLAEQLAATQGYSVSTGVLTRRALDEAQAVFALSDEFGFIPLKESAPAADTLKRNISQLFGSV